MLDRFEIAEQQPAGVVNRWISAMVQLFRPQISSLLHTRDQNVMSWRRRHRTQVFEDPLLEVTSSLDIDLDAQLAFLERVRCGPADMVLPRSLALPPMAEGWGDGHAG